jgi:urease accessory protein
MRHRYGRGAVLLALVLTAGIAPAHAHHVMGGRTPATFMQGVLSGLGHPVIGLDHLAFLIAVGIAVGLARLSLAMPFVFVAASALGVTAHLQGLNLPGAEFLVALSVVLIGVLVARGAALAPLAWGGLFALAGLFHGYAFGESIFGAETTPLAAYLLGLVVIQGAITAGVAYAVRTRGAAVTDIAPRLTGAAIAGIGIAFIAQQVLPAG